MEHWPDTLQYLIWVVSAGMAWALKELWQENKNIKTQFGELSLMVVGKYVDKELLEKFQEQMRNDNKQIMAQLRVIELQLAERRNKDGERRKEGE